MKKDPVSYVSKWCITDKFYDRYLKCRDVRLHYDKLEQGKEHYNTVTTVCITNAALHKFIGFRTLSFGVAMSCDFEGG